MHICHVTGALVGGIITSIAWLSRRQAAEGHHISLVYSSVRGDLWSCKDRYRHVHTAAPWRVNRSIGPSDILALVDLHAILRYLEPDIVHLHGSKAGVLGRIVCRMLGLPCIYSPRGVSFVRTDRFVRARLYRAIEAVLGAGRIPVTACSPSEAFHLRRVSDNVRVIPNAVELATITEINRENKVDNPAFTIGILGLIKYQRMPELVAKLCREAPANWRWVWVGDGPLRHLLEGLPNLSILGWREHADGLRLIGNVDVVLHASRWEGMPNALLEAMALGKPAVVSDVVGTRDIIEHGVDGFLVGDVFSTNAYLSALRILEADRRLRAEIGKRARERVYREHDADVVFRQWRDLYEQVLANNVQPERTRRRRSPTPAGAIADLSGLDV